MLTPIDDRAAVELDRLAQLGGDALGGRGRLVDARDAIEQDRELVAALAGGDVARSGWSRRRRRATSIRSRSPAR